LRGDGRGREDEKEAEEVEVAGEEVKEVKGEENEAKVTVTEARKRNNCLSHCNILG
jgi:2-C-methyl-D-erythritol 4-phosphate cytidylyltransferase